MIKHDIDKEKIFLENYPINFEKNFSFKFEISNVVIELNYHGKSFLNVIKFLNEYFQKFNQSLKEPDMIINYFNPLNEIGHSTWTYWNEWEHEIECRKRDNQYLIIQRDFVGLFDGEKQINCIGPEWSFATCDSIDNIIGYLLPKVLLQKSGLILHSASIVLNDEAYVFFGQSGAGKSTLATVSERLNQAKVISSDQSILFYKENQLYSSLMPTTIPEFPLNHPSRCHRPVAVKTLIYLYQGSEDFKFMKLSDVEWIKLFMKEIIYRKEFFSENNLLKLSMKILNDKSIFRGSMCYNLNVDFIKELQKEFI